MLLLNWVCLLSLWFLSNVVKSQCPVAGQIPPTQGGMHNFILDEFTGGTFPFAINQCTAISIPASKWYKYTCVQASNQWTVVKTSYSDKSCSGTGTVLRTFYSNETNATNDFECNGVNSFAKIGISVSSDCSSSVTLYAGLSGCARAGASQFEFFCNSSVAFVNFFRSVLNQTMNSTGVPMSTTGVPMSTTGVPMSTTGAPMSTTTLGLTSTLNANVTSTMLNSTMLNSTMLNSTMLNSTMLNSTMLNNTMPSSTMLNSTQSTTGLASSTAIPVTTGILATLLSSTMLPTVVQQTCLSDDYCEVWILPSGQCVYANTSAFRSSQIKIYGQLLQCNDNSTGATGSTTTTSTTQPTKSASGLQVAITAVFTLLLAISWI